MHILNFLFATLAFSASPPDYVFKFYKQLIYDSHQSLLEELWHLNHMSNKIEMLSRVIADRTALLNSIERILQIELETLSNFREYVEKAWQYAQFVFQEPEGFEKAVAEAITKAKAPRDFDFSDPKKLGEEYDSFTPTDYPLSTLALSSSPPDYIYKFYKQLIYDSYQFLLEESWDRNRMSVKSSSEIANQGALRDNVDRILFIELKSLSQFREYIQIAWQVAQSVFRKPEDLQKAVTEAIIKSDAPTNFDFSNPKKLGEDYDSFIPPKSEPLDYGQLSTFDEFDD